MSEVSTTDYQNAFIKLADQYQLVIGFKLFTASYVDYAKDIGVRIYSSDNVLYPSGGKHEVNESNVWTDTIVSQKTYIANYPSEFDIEHFTNLDTLIAQGFGSVINIPIVINENVVGTINLLDSEGAYSDSEKITCAHESIEEQVTLAYQGYIATLLC